MSISRFTREKLILEYPIGLFLTAIGFHLLLTVGCGNDNQLGRQAIEGKVILDGNPVAHGSIEFTPRQQGGVSSGAVISDGHYEIDTAKGLPPGSYLVRIFAPEMPKKGAAKKDIMGITPGGMAPIKDILGVERIPAEYNVRSKQIIEISAEGPNQFSYEIKTK